MEEISFHHKKINTEKLLLFGFTASDAGYLYKTDLLNGQFELQLSVTGENKAVARLMEKAFGEEYTLHLIADAAGAFVGSVRKAYQAVIADFLASCCEPDAFGSGQARLVIGYVKDVYGDDPEYLWEKFPQNAVFRRKDTKSWYGALLSLPRRKLGFDSDAPAEILDLRLPPERMAETVDGLRYFPGYHMNKKNWFTIVLDGSVDAEEIFSHIDESYRLAAKKVKK